MDVIDSTPHQGSDPTLCGSGITIRTLSEEQAGKKKAKYERKKKKQMNKIVASLNDTEKLEVEKARRDLLRRRYASIFWKIIEYSKNLNMDFLKLLLEERFLF